MWSTTGTNVDFRFLLGSTTNINLCPRLLLHNDPQVLMALHTHTTSSCGVDIKASVYSKNISHDADIRASIHT